MAKEAKLTPLTRQSQLRAITEILHGQLAQLTELEQRFFSEYNLVFDREVVLEAVSRWRERTARFINKYVGATEDARFRSISLPLTALRGSTSLRRGLGGFRGYLSSLIIDMRDFPYDPKFEQLQKKPKAARRQKIPPDSEQTVLIQCRRRCCLCWGLNGQNEPVAGQIAHIDGNPRNNALDNLVWLCLPHHDAFDSRTSQSKGLKQSEVRHYRDHLIDIFQSAPPSPSMSLTPRPAQTIGEIHAGRDVVTGSVTNNTHHHYAGKRRPARIAPPAGSIGDNAEMRAYLTYLTSRYIECRQHAIERGIDRRKFHPGTLAGLIKKNFGNSYLMLPTERFEDVATFVKRAIDQTIWGKNSRSRNYHSFEEHAAKMNGKSR